MKDYSKSGPMGKLRKVGDGKTVSEQFLQYGETVQLPGGAPTMRKFDKNYKKPENREPEAPMAPMMPRTYGF